MTAIGIWGNQVGHSNCVQELNTFSADSLLSMASIKSNVLRKADSLGYFMGKSVTNCSHVRIGFSAISKSEVESKTFCKTFDTNASMS